MGDDTWTPTDSIQQFANASRAVIAETSHVPTVVAEIFNNEVKEFFLI